VCRISLVKGKILNSASIINSIGELQKFGATLEPEIFNDGDLTIISSRFDVTSSEFHLGEFPLQNEKYVLSFNGEVYSFRNVNFSKSNSLSDVHFALDLINTYGHSAFFEEADFEGTFILYDKFHKELFIYADQLNTKGCFYSMFDSSILLSQEYTIVNTILNQNSIEQSVPIFSLKRGNCLRIFSDGKYQVYEYKPDFNVIWSSLKKWDIKTSTTELQNALIQSLETRIPIKGIFGVLCSGGVDSSIILKLTYDYLKKTNNLDRLFIFTLGSDSNTLSGENNDLENVYILLEYLGINSDEFLHIINVSDRWRDFLLTEEILCLEPHLVTPNPVQTQVRHVISMSCVLAEIAIKHPNINVILTGDFADEIFAGYNSMHTGNLDELRNIIQVKLDDLQLNDASRVTLSSLHGCKLLCERFGNFAKTNSKSHPIEIRTPYASPCVAKALSNIDCQNLIGEYENQVHSKYILRLVAEHSGVPKQIAWRKKIPFNEGGTGTKNMEEDHLEEEIAKAYIEKYFDLFKSINTKSLQEKNISTTTFFEKALLYSAMLSGIERLLIGNSFRKVMLDSNYSTRGNLNEIYNFNLSHTYDYTKK
jgi:asparagine synthetase B (glutamine-hydrolysing)